MDKIWRVFEDVIQRQELTTYTAVQYMKNNRRVWHTYLVLKIAKYRLRVEENVV